MQLRCTYCQTMFAISHEETLAAMEHMEESGQKFYDAHCPKCRRSNRIERFRLEFSYPNWREDLKQMAKNRNTAATKVQPASSTSQADEIPEGQKRHSHKPASRKVEPAAPKQKAAIKKATAKPKPAAAKKPATKPAPAARKTTAKTVSKPVKKSTTPTPKSKKPVSKTKGRTAKK